MNIGLFFGSFNPVHNGHVKIAREFLEHQYFEQVWLIVSPQNPLKAQEGLADQNHRLKMAQLATENDENIKVSDVEFSLPVPSYTINTLNFLSDNYAHQFSIIMGADNIQSIDRWKDYLTLTNNYNIFVYKRDSYHIPDKYINLPNIKVVDFPFINISATAIRTVIKTTSNASEYLSDSVLAYVKAHKLFKN